jgi:RNA polymerase sigma-70 factor (ECF subfamily)
MNGTEGSTATMERPSASSAPRPLVGASDRPNPVAAGQPEPIVLRASDPARTPRRRDAASEAAFEDLYRTEYRPIVAIVHSLTGRRDVAEEIVQDAFVVAHDRWAKISGYDRPADFVRRVALNRALSSLRRRGAEHRALARWQGRAPAASPALHADDESGLWAAVRRLPPRQAHAVALMYVEDQSVLRIAQILDCSENTVKTHLKRARATLATALAETGGGRPGGGRT